MTAVETFAMPQQRATDVYDEKTDDEDDPIASIKAMSITVGDHDSSPFVTTKQDSNIATSTTLTSPSSPPSTKGYLQPPAKPTSSLRSLLGVPLSSNGKTDGGGGGLLGVPPSTSSLTAPAGIGGASGARIGGIPTSTVKTLPSEIAPKRRKVILGPGCSALDWARLKSTIPSKGFRKIRPSELKLHNTKQSAWAAFNGKVYDMTPYLRFHPGGEDELMRVAGRDGTRLFSEHRLEQGRW
jgi:hypothetical protein